MTTYQILYWHDIPTTVRAREGRVRARVHLSPRFMEAVDKAALAARHTNLADYREGFYWSDAVEREGSPEEVAEIVASEIESEYKIIPWRETAQMLREQSGE